MKRLITILITTVITLNIWGAKAYPLPLTITQKDGKTLTYQLHGDENFNYAATTDGVLLYQTDNDFFIAVINEKGEMESSGVLAHNAGQRTAEEIALIGKQDKDKYFAAEKASVAKSRGMKRIGIPENTLQPFFPHLGSPRALVILADFKDQKFKHDDDSTIAIFDQYLNSMEPFNPEKELDPTLCRNYGSVRKYFSDMSGGQFTPIFDVAAIVHLSDSMKVYGPGKKDNMPKFFKEVCDSANKTVNFANYDADGDNNVDLVYVIYAGYGQSTGGGDNTIWPKSSSFNKSNDYLYNGKYIRRYGVNPELNFSPTYTTVAFRGVPQINGIGLFCHEFSHCMNLPDIYPVTTDAQQAYNPGMEYWDLMDGGEYGGSVTFTHKNKQYTIYGGYNPTAYTAWEREYMGWMEMDVLTDDNGGEHIELINIDENGGKAYKIFPDDDVEGNEYVFIQNIQPYKWNTWLGESIGHGMLVTYVCYDKEAFSLDGYGMYDETDGVFYRVNDKIGYSRMTYIPADGEYISSYSFNNFEGQAAYIASHAGDPFPGTSNNHALRSIPMRWSENTMEKPLLSIRENNGVVSFYYLVGPQIATDINGIDFVSTPNETRVYTLDGRYVGKSTRGLAKGVYIINGKKTVIR
jgi:immune inhibitor A